MIQRTYLSPIVYSLLKIVGICSVVGLMSGLSWVFDLFNHFRPQALVAACFLLLCSLALKDKKSTILSLSIIALNSGLMLERLHAFPAIKSQQAVNSAQEISVIFSNVLTANTNHAAVLNMIKKNDPDIFVTTEVDEKWITALSKLAPSYAHSTELPRADNFGMAIYSKLPFTARIYDVGTYELPIAVLDFSNFLLIAAHPIPPLSANHAQELLIYVTEIANVIGRTKKPVMLVGDFNATMWSKAFGILSGLGLQRTNKIGLAYTWPTGFFPLGIQIDHILVRGASAASFETLPYIGSDHFPVSAKIHFEKPR